LSVIAFIVTLSVLIIVHEFGHFIVSKRNGVRVERFSLGFGPKLFGFTVGETEYVVSLFPLGGYVKLSGQEPGEELKNEPWEYLSKSTGTRARIIFAGPMLNYILGFVLFTSIFMVGSPTLTTEIGGLLDDYPAKRSGLRQGDRVLAVDGAAVARWEDMAAMIRKKVSGEEILLEIERDGDTRSISIAPLVKEGKDIFGNIRTIALLGITPSQKAEMVRYGPLRSVYMGSKKIITLTAMTYKAIWSMVTGRLSLKESMTGPIGIFVITGKVAELGIVHLLHFMGILSVSLAIFNLLPIPVLDGGHLLFLAVEKIRKRPLSVKTQERITNAGLSLLIVVMLFFFYNDIIRFKIFEAVARWFRR